MVNTRILFAFLSLLSVSSVWWNLPEATWHDDVITLAVRGMSGLLVVQNFVCTTIYILKPYIF